MNEYTLEDVNYAECEIDNSYFLSVLLSEISYNQKSK